MASMRLYSRQELEGKLGRLGWENTGETSKTSEYWQAENGKLLTVPQPDPVSDCYSDFIYDDIIRAAIKLAD